MKNKYILVCLTVFFTIYSYADLTNKTNSFLTSKKWNEGLNSKVDGSEFFIAVGMAVINSSPSDSMFMKSRENAFKKAMLQSKARLAEFFGNEISSKTEFKFSSQSTSVTKKTVGLAKEKLKQLSQKTGESESVVKNSSEFKDFISSMAKAFIGGIQAYQTFEEFSDKTGEVAVIAVWSEKSLMYANAIAENNTSLITTNKKSRSIFDSFPKENVLSATFGVKIRTDENGRKYIIAFAQDSPVNDSRISLNASYAKATTKASSMIRNFLGESVSAKTNVSTSTSLNEIEDINSIYTSDSNYEQHIQTFAKKLKIYRISPVKRWHQIHPSGKHIAGVISVLKTSKISTKNPDGSKRKISATDEKENNTVTVYPIGKTLEEAIRKGITEAIRSVNGGYIESDSKYSAEYTSLMGEGKFLDGTKASVKGEFNKEKMSSKIKEETKGFIKGYKIISKKVNKDKLYELVMSVHVFKYDADNPREGQLTIVVLPFGYEDDEMFLVDNKKKLPAYEVIKDVTKIIRTKLVDANQFIVIDRDDMAKVLKEQSMTKVMVKLKMSNLTEMGKIGNLLSADFLVMGNVESIKYSKKFGMNKETGKFGKIETIKYLGDYKLLNVGSGRIETSENLNIKLKGGDFKSLDSDDSKYKFLLKNIAKVVVDKLVKLKGKEK